MSAPTISHVSVATYIGMIDEIISWSQGRGLHGDANRLRSRLDALSKRDREDREAERASTRAPDWAYMLEQQLVVDELLGSLLPEVLVDLVDELRSRRVRSGADPGVWAALDRRSFAENRFAQRKREVLAESDVLMSLRDAVPWRRPESEEEPGHAAMTRPRGGQPCRVIGCTSAGS